MPKSMYNWPPHAKKLATRATPKDCQQHHINSICKKHQPVVDTVHQMAHPVTVWGLLDDRCLPAPPHCSSPQTPSYETAPRPTAANTSHKDTQCESTLPILHISTRLPSNPRMRAFSYASSLPVTWQRWPSHHSIHYSWKHHAACKLHGSMFYGTRVTASRSCTLRE